MSEPAARRASDGPFERWVCFGLGEVIYGLPILRVQEVLQVPAIESVPGTAPTVLGVINLRGQVVSVIDLRLHLGFAANPIGPDARIIVMENQGETLGLLVDRVTDVRKVVEAAIKPAPGVDVDRRAPLIGVVSRGGELLTLLDADRLLQFSA